MLGPIELLAQGEPIGPIAAKPRALLVYLALAPGRVVPVAALIDALWGDDPPARAQNALQVYVSGLRKQLRNALGSDPTTALATHPVGYALALEPEMVDAARFERLLADGRRALAAGDPHGAASLLDAALDEWRGEVPFVGIDAPFVVASATRLEALRLDCVELRVDAALEVDDPAGLVPDLEALLIAHPFREGLWARLMHCLYRAGRQADALGAFQRARDVLLEELGLDPGPELVALEAAILRHDPDLAAPARPVAVVIDEPAASVPERQAARPRSLARPTVQLVGRVRERVALLAALRDDASIVSLVGPGGAGKTTLALDVANELAAAGAFPGGCHWVALDAVRDVDLVVPAIAAVLGVEGGRDPVEEIAGALGDEPVLLVLDNVEQVVGVAPTLARLVASAPALVLLCTTRIPLRVGGEREVALGGLALPEATAMLVASARAIRADFAVDGDEATAEAIERICERLDGLPLAIELASARLRTLTPQALANRIASDFAALGRAHSDAPHRHRSLDATLEWSLDLLQPDEQYVFACAGAFVNGCSLAALETVSSPHRHTGSDVDVLDALDRLIEASLVSAPPVGDRVPRYRLLETVRDYAARTLSARADADDVRDRHAAFYTAVPARALGAEDLPNVRTAIGWLLERGRPTEAAAALVELRQLFFHGASLREGADWFERLEQLAADLPRQLAARVEILAGVFGFFVGRKDGVKQRLEHGIDELRAIDDSDEVALNALLYLAEFALDDDDLQGADALALDAIAWAQRAGDAPGEGMSLDFRARVAQHAGDRELAVELLRDAVDRQRGRVADAQLAQCLGRLAGAAGEAGRRDDAFAAAHEAVAFADSSGSAPARRDAQFGLGQVHLLLGERTRGVTALARSAHAARAIGEPGWEELAWLALALAPIDSRAAGYLAGAARTRLGRTGAVGRRFDEIVQRAELEADGDAFRAAFASGTSAAEADVEALLEDLAAEDA